MKRWKIVLMMALAMFVSLFAATQSRADGLIIIHDPPHVIPGHFTFAPLEVTYHNVDVSIEDNVAVTSIDQEFKNPNNARLEGTYIFPIPEGAHIDKFSMDINGKMMEAELLPADKARSIYEDIVRKMKDPALLEYVGRDAFKVRIFPIEPNSTKRVKISYTQLLKSDSGVTEYTYPLNTEKFSSVPLKNVSVKVSLKTKDPIKNIYCPTHNVEIKRNGDSAAVVGYEEKNVRPDTDFKITWSHEKKDIDINLLIYRKGSDDGYFLLMASPGKLEEKDNIQPKDICFVLDTSGSMADKKLDQAKKALKFCLANLNQKDRFEIIRFSTEAEPFFGKLCDATKENIDKAVTFVEAMKPIGGTAISDALGKALDNAKNGDGRPYLVVFLTDGLPTIGETKEDSIVEQVKKQNNNVRIFSFGIGTDVNTHMLDRIAGDTRAVSQYVLPTEDIEVKLSNFYGKIKDPVLTDLKLEFTSGIKVSQVYPNVMPDLFNGDTLIVFGKYSGDGKSAVKLTGKLSGKEKTFAEDVSFERENTSREYIPKLWATRRVGWLLDEIRIRGESAELKDEVTKLARDFGIVTPYTAYLIMEDEAKRDVPVPMRNFQEMSRDDRVAKKAEYAYKGFGREAAEEKLRSGSDAVMNSMTVGGMKDGWNMQQAAKAPAAQTMAKEVSSGGYRVAQNYSQQARVVNGRAFYQNGSQWTDSTIQGQKNLKQQKVVFNSAEYFELLKNNKEAAPWLSLGTDIDVVIKDTVYQIRGS